MTAKKANKAKQAPRAIQDPSLNSLISLNSQYRGR